MTWQVCACCVTNYNRLTPVSFLSPLQTAAGFSGAEKMQRNFWFILPGGSSILIQSGREVRYPSEEKQIVFVVLFEDASNFV